jgi:hypothetical protein
MIVIGYISVMQHAPHSNKEHPYPSLPPSLLYRRRRRCPPREILGDAKVAVTHSLSDRFRVILFL